VGLIEQRAGLAPRLLLVTPVRKLGTHDGEGVRTDLRIPQQLNRVSAGQELFK
jgi:hypothetical protein